MVRAAPPRVPRGALRGGPPAFVEPQLATLVKAAPEGERWLHELKFDGYRILARLERGAVRLASRNGNDWTARLPTIRDAIAALPARAALLDGEAAVLMPDGTTRFQAMQHAAATGGLRYFAFDLVHLDGVDPLEERKAALAALLARADAGVLVYSDHVVGRGPAFFRSACQRGLEGIISKRRDAPYASGRGEAWVKTKCVKRQELVIGGYTLARGAASSGDGALGALLVGHHEGGTLIYAGKVGTGFQRSATALYARLRRLARATSPFVGKVPGAGAARWVTPSLVCEVEFIEWTADGRLRHPSFKGLREDKRAKDVVRERAHTPPA
jgi:bifunctional non-homologous end joining protein LigD